MISQAHIPYRARNKIYRDFFSGGNNHWNLSNRTILSGYLKWKKKFKLFNIVYIRTHTHITAKPKGGKNKKKNEKAEDEKKKTELKSLLCKWECIQNASQSVNQKFSSCGVNKVHKRSHWALHQMWFGSRECKKKRKRKANRFWIWLKKKGQRKKKLSRKKRIKSIRLGIYFFVAWRENANNGRHPSKKKEIERNETKSKSLRLGVFFQSNFKHTLSLS